MSNLCFSGSGKVSARSPERETAPQRPRQPMVHAGITLVRKSLLVKGQVYDSPFFPSCRFIGFIVPIWVGVKLDFYVPSDLMLMFPF